MFRFETVIRLAHTDAAGIIFYGRLFDLIHFAYEAMLDDIGFPLPTDVAQAPVVLPIVHASADYRSPLRLNDRVDIEVAVEKVGERSFTLGYRVTAGDQVCVEARTVHVAVSRVDYKAAPLPDELARELRSRIASR